MSGAANVTPLCASEFMAAHLMEFFGEHGGAALGILVEGYVTGLSAAMASTVGPEATYAVLQRHADAVALQVIGKRAGD